MLYFAVGCWVAPYTWVGAAAGAAAVLYGILVVYLLVVRCDEVREVSLIMSRAAAVVFDGRKKLILGYYTVIGAQLLALGVYLALAYVMGMVFLMF